MKRIRLLIADAEPTYLERVSKYMSTKREIEVVGYTTDGFEAVKMIQRLQPDCLLLSLVLYRVNGLSLLRSINIPNYAPAVILCSAFYSMTALKLALNSGTDLFLGKPITLQHLYECVITTTAAKRCMAEEMCSLNAAENEPSPADIVLRKLLDVGISPRMSGFSCLAEGLKQLLPDSMPLRNLRRSLYPRIAQNLRMTPETVERNIRTAIQSAKKNADSDVHMLTNRQFFTRLLREIDEDPAFERAY